MLKPGTHVPTSVPREIVSPQRHAICLAFAARVQSASRMICQGKPKDEIIALHGSVVYREACFNWRDYWQPITFDSEGRAIFGEPKMSVEDIASQFVNQKRSELEI